VNVGYNGVDHGFPRIIETKQQLIDTCATIIWIVSAQHAVLNFIQYECYGWVPAHPGSLSIAPLGHPESKWVHGKLTMDEILHGLPSKDASSKQIGLAYILSQYSGEDYMLGKYPETYFTESTFFHALKTYNDALTEYGKEIDARKATDGPNHWDHLHPTKIPNATAV